MSLDVEVKSVMMVDARFVWFKGAWRHERIKVPKELEFNLPFAWKWGGMWEMRGPSRKAPGANQPRGLSANSRLKLVCKCNQKAACGRA